MARLFYSFNEAALFLKTDEEGLRQIFAYSPSNEVSLLPAFAESGPRAFLCRLAGEAIQKQADPNKDLDSATLRGIVKFGLYGSDKLCFWEQQEKPRERTGFDVVYAVSGIVRVDPDKVIHAAKDGYVDGAYIYPPSWFAEDSPIGLGRDNIPMANFLPLSSHEDTYGYRGPIKKLSELIFFESDLIKYLDNRTSDNAINVRNSAKDLTIEKKLRPDAINTYEKIIAALWLKAHGKGGAGSISDKPHSAAESLAKLLAQNGILKPDVDTIGRRLAEAKKTGLKIGNSDKES